MMGKVIVIGDRYSVALFKMLGTEGLIIEDPLNIENYLKEIKRREDVDLVLITKDIYDPVREKVDNFILSQKRPLVGIIPSPFSEATPIDTRKLIMRALGFG
jgi:V/A-type H+-transporting ATPase subunit F